MRLDVWVKGGHSPPLHSPFSEPYSVHPIVINIQHSLQHCCVRLCSKGQGS